MPSRLALRQSRFQVAVESRLRVARLFRSESHPLLHVNVHVLRSAFSTRVQFIKPVRDTLSGRLFVAPTWNIATLGMHGGNPNYILSDISESLDHFLVEFLRVNEEACEKR